MKKTTIEMSDDLYARLQHEAERRGHSDISERIEEFLRSEPGP